jgi:hypothetical protein
MSIKAASRTEHVHALPTFAEAALLIGLDHSDITQAAKQLGIKPVAREQEQYLTVFDVFQIAIYASGLALEEVGGELLDWAERERSVDAEIIRAEIDAFFAALPEPIAVNEAALLTPAAGLTIDSGED